MRVLILGGGGMLGHRIFRVLSDSMDCYTTFRFSEELQVYPFYRDSKKTMTGVDVLNFDTVVSALAWAQPEVVINCIGIIKQMREAKDPILSIRVNSLFPHQLASLCEAMDARLIHISTDCVFNGSKGDYIETDPPDASDLYGRSKGLGEIVGREGCLTLRTSIVGWDLAKADSLLEWFWLQRGKTIKGYVNAVFSGLSTRAIAIVMKQAIQDDPGLSGLYQVSSIPVNKYDLLSRFNRALELGAEIEPCTEPRIDRSLDSSRFRDTTGVSIPSWDDMISELAHDRANYDSWKGNW